MKQVILIGGLAIGGAAILAAQAASASVIILDGANPTNTPADLNLANEIPGYAIAMGTTSGTYTVQGVTFADMPAADVSATTATVGNFSLKFNNTFTGSGSGSLGALALAQGAATSWPVDSNAGSDTGAAAANDAALMTIANNEAYVGVQNVENEVLTTISHLTPGTTYQIDTIITSGPRHLEVFYNNSATDSDDLGNPDSAADIYDVEDDVTAQDDGTIDVTVRGIDHSAAVSALIVSAVPEPASASLLVLGGAATLLRRRKTRA